MKDCKIKIVKTLMLTVVLILAMCLPAYAHNPFLGIDTIYEGDFEGFAGGSGGYKGFEFWNRSKVDGIAAVNIDDFHGTSAKIVDLYPRGVTSYTINGRINLGSYTSGKYVFEFEIYPTSWLTAPFVMAPVSSSGKSGADVLTVSGRSLKAGGRTEKDSRYTGVLNLGRWSKVQVYIDLDEGKYTTYLDGKALGDARDTCLSGSLAAMYFITYPIDSINHGDICIDNVCFYKAAEPINQSEIGWSLTVSDKSAEIVFSDDVDPTLINKNNITLLKDGAKTDFEITDKSYRAFCAELKESFDADALYTLDIGGIAGTGRGALEETRLDFPGKPGDYKYIAHPEASLKTSVEGNEIRVVNHTGESRRYTLIIGYYKDGSLCNIKCFGGTLGRFEESTAYSVSDAADKEIRAFIIDEKDRDKYFGSRVQQ